MFKNSKLKLTTIIAFAILIIYLSPLYWMFISGLKTQAETYTIPPTLIPATPLFSNYINIVRIAIPYLRNSLIIAVSATFITLFFGTTGGYALARLKTKWVQWFVLVFLVAQMLPDVLRVTPLFVIFRDLGLINNYLSVILSISTLTVPFAVIMLRASFLEVPVELEEAALIDGCDKLKAFWKVSLPLAKPGIMIVATMSFIWSYGDFIFSLSFLRNRAMHPATVGLYNFIGAEVIHWNRIMAFAFVTALPLIILFIALQKYIIRGLSTGALD